MAFVGPTLAAVGRVAATEAAPALGQAVAKTAPVLEKEAASAFGQAAKNGKGDLVENLKETVQSEVIGAVTGKDDKEKKNEGNADNKEAKEEAKEESKEGKDDKDIKKAKDSAPKLNPSDYSGKSISDSLGADGTDISMSSGANISSSGNNTNTTSIMEGVSSILELLSIIGYLTIYGTYIIITFLCFINVIIFLIKVLIEFFSNDSTKIYKDTIKYQLLEYVDFAIQNQDNPFTATAKEGEKLSKIQFSEPFFFLYFINFLLTFIVMVYVVLAIIYALVIVIIVILWGGCTLNAIDCGSIGRLIDDKGNNLILKYINAPVLMGALCVGILYGLHILIFKNYIFSELRNVREKVLEIDKQILDSIAVDKIDKSLINILIKNRHEASTRNAILNAYFCKKLGIVQDNIPPLAVTYLNDVNVVTSKDSTTMNEIVGELTFVTLYTNVYDSLPIKDTRANDAIESINLFFFKDPNPIKDDANDTSKTAETAKSSDSTSTIKTSFIGLMPASKGITRIRKIYRTDIFTFKNVVDDSVQTMLIHVDKKIDDINASLLKFPGFKNMLFGVGVYLFIIFLIALILLIAYSVVIVQYTKDKGDTLGIGKLASSVLGISGYVAPITSGLILSTTYPEQYTACNEQNKDPSTTMKCFVKPHESSGGINDTGFNNPTDQGGMYDNNQYQ